MTDADRFHELVTSLAALRRAPGVAPWDAARVLEWLCSSGLSHGEAIAARFVLGVWNADADWVAEAKERQLPNPEAARRFDLLEATVLDAPHRTAIAAWFAAPFFP